MKWKHLPTGEIRELFPGQAEGYQCQIEGNCHLFCIITPDAPGGWHMSISTRTNGRHTRPAHRYPSWDEIVDARYRFIPDEARMAMMLPPRSEYLNLHQTCFHLHQQ